MFLHIPYKCKIEQHDALQHNGETNSERQICTESWSICQQFPLKIDEHHIKTNVNRQYFQRKFLRVLREYNAEAGQKLAKVIYGHARQYEVFLSTSSVRACFTCQ